MLFNSLEFLVLFMPVTLLIALRLRGQPLLRWISLASLIFYAFAGHWWFILPMFATIIIDYEAALVLQHARNMLVRRAALGTSLAGNLGLLAYFKYGGLFARTAVELLGAGSGTAQTARWFDVILPAGISFYTFQTLSYVIDVWRGVAPAERNFARFLGFVSFFPHLVAGPLTRHHQLIPQLARVADSGIDPRWREGVLIFCVGLTKKVLVADRLGNMIDPLLTQTGELDAVHAWLALLGYALQIYFDFSAYSDMAIGLGRLFGIELPQNFASPYKAVSPADFWRRWHMTLSFWLRDYLYITLGGNRCSPGRQRFNLMTTMVLGGLWHGANWTFAAWGAWHGLLLVAHHTFRAWSRPLSTTAQRNVTFLGVTVGWVFFRSQSFGQALEWFGGLAGLHGVALSAPDVRLLILVIVSFIIVRRCPNSLEIRFDQIRPLPQVALAGATAVSLLLMNYSSKFLYFQF
jgi:alginate O-acetyltransferase complex protein AlgI